VTVVVKGTVGLALAAHRAGLLTAAEVLGLPARWAALGVRIHPRFTAWLKAAAC